MRTRKIWSLANDHRELIRSINRALVDGRSIDGKMDALKRLMPSLVGVDAGKNALVFNSSDEGTVSLSMEEQNDTFMIALNTDIQLAGPGDFRMDMLSGM